MKRVLIGTAAVLTLVVLLAFLPAIAAPPQDCSEECPPSPPVVHLPSEFCNNAHLVRGTLYWESSALGSFGSGVWSMQLGASATIRSSVVPNGYGVWSIEWDGGNSYHGSVLGITIVEDATLTIVDKFGNAAVCDQIHVSN